MVNRRILLPLFKYILIVVIPILVIFWIVGNYRVKEIECKSQFNRCSSDLVQKIDSVDRASIFETGRNVNNILSGEVSLRRFSIQLKLNGKIQVYIEERVPVYCLKSGNFIYYADAEGIVIKNVEGNDTECILKEDVKYNLGEMISDSDRNMFLLFHKLKIISEKRNPRFENGNLTVEYKGKVKLIFPIDGDYDLSAGKAYYIVSQFDNIKEYIISNGKSDISEIDLRFKNPVIKVI